MPAHPMPARSMPALFQLMSEPQIVRQNSRCSIEPFRNPLCTSRPLGLKTFLQ